MYPFSPFARPTGSFQIPVSPPVPTGGSCSTLSVQFPSEWLPYILGALQQLTLQSTWKGTPAEIIEAQQRAQAIIGSIQKASCFVPVPELHGMEVEDKMGIRVDCDCRVFITCCDGSEIELLTSKNPGPGQPGAGSKLPPANGGTADYCFLLAPRDASLLPTLVNSGDIITITKAGGAWNDGNSLFWYCPSGWQFILGNCSNTPITAMGQLLLSSRYMGLIARIGGTYYDVFQPDSSGNAQPFTVPPGIVNQPVEFVANFIPSAPGLPTGGMIDFCVNVQNNLPGTWSHDFDFTLSDWGFVPESAATGTPGVYTPGTGWVGQDAQPTSGQYYHLVEIHRALAGSGFTITEARFAYTMTTGQIPIPSNQAGGIFTPSAPLVTIPFSSLVNGSSILDTGPVSSASPSDIELYIASAGDTGSTPPSPPGSCAIIALHVEGTGVDPF